VVATVLVLISRMPVPKRLRLAEPPATPEDELPREYALSGPTAQG
jgi:hypothetical protein